jgi:hypothetical protein
MRLTLLTFLFILLISSSAHCFELITIQAVAEGKKTFVTRLGKRQGAVVGITGTFTAEDVSVLAKAITVTGNFTQWQLINPEAILPFEKGAIVTYYPATEYIWALAPEAERKKYIKSQVPAIKQSWLLKGGFIRGLSETVSEAPPGNQGRGGFMGEIYWERDLTHSLAFDLGLRYEREVTNYPGATYLTQRNLLVGHLLYYFDDLKDYIPGRLFIGGGLGYGVSNTSTVGLSQTGPASMLPSAKLGISLPFNHDWDFVLDAAFESLNSREQREDASIQTTTQTNFRTGFGLRRYF